MYRLLRAKGQLRHRGHSKPRTRRPPREHVATGPNQVWSWDITWLKSPVRGVYYYLYLVEDVWSRKIIGWQVHEREGHDLAAVMLRELVTGEDAPKPGLVLHADNGNAMRGSSMLSTMQRLGIVPSFSRPGVSDDNPFSEALFRTMKYRPNYPSKPFASIDEARRWVANFVHWYNTEHRHGAIRFLTPAQRHDGQQEKILARRDALYRRAQRKRPERWTGGTRNWTPISIVRLNPSAAAERAAPAALIASAAGASARSPEGP